MFHEPVYRLISGCGIKISRAECLTTLAPSPSKCFRRLCTIYTGATLATRTTPYLCMEQHGQHHTTLWSNTDNTILMYGATRTTPTTPYFSMEQHGQHHTYVWSNTDNTILMYGATRTTPYLCMEQHEQHHTYIL